MLLIIVSFAPVCNVNMTLLYNYNEQINTLSLWMDSCVAMMAGAHASPSSDDQSPGQWTL